MAGENSIDATRDYYVLLLARTIIVPKMAYPRSFERAVWSRCGQFLIVTAATGSVYVSEVELILYHHVENRLVKI